VRRVVASIAVLGACAALTTACSNSGNGGAPTVGGTKIVCTLVGQLDRTGTAVEQADVHDPAAFDRALAGAVKKYVAILDDLHDAVPNELRDDVEHLRAAVQQYRFNDGVDARVAIDAYANRTCT
jgi:hypothetical protein